jgi:hypothetical protein
LSAELRARIQRARNELAWVDSAGAAELLERAADDLGVVVDATRIVTEGMSALELGNMTHAELVGKFRPHFQPGTSIPGELADQVQLCRAFEDPAKVVASVSNQVAATIGDFPSTAADLKVGSNPADVLDPYIMAANFELLSSQDLARTVETSLSHKVLMKIEDLVGNLHQKVLGEMRGNFRVPEPQGGRSGNKDIIHPAINPFPGADIGQVPTPQAPRSLRLFQVKNKTGSAKGGDGPRLGIQLKRLEQTYGAETFYVAIVGTTLKGHRSMGAVLRESPNTVVLVGEAALAELTRSSSGPELLLRTYARGFRAAAAEQGYDFTTVATQITGSVQEEADEVGGSVLEAWLREAVGGERAAQDSRLYQSHTHHNRRRGGR